MSTETPAPFRITEPGIYDISAEQYHADPCVVPSLSSSIAKILVNSTPLHAWTQHSRLNKNFVEKERTLFDLGTVAHALMLQGLEIGHVIQAQNKEGVTVSDYKTKAAKEERDAARAAGQVPILEEQWARLQVMVLAGKAQLAAHKEARDVFTDSGKPERSLIWEDDRGVICRARLDWLRNDFRRVADYKGTGTSINPEGIGRFAVSQGWDLQAAFYRRGIKKLTGQDADFLFVAQEDFAPHALAVIGMGPDFLWAGEAKVDEAINKWADCTESGNWPAYPDRICYPALPSFEETRITEKQLRDQE